MTGTSRNRNWTSQAQRSGEFDGFDSIGISRRTLRFVWEQLSDFGSRVHRLYIILACRSIGNPVIREALLTADLVRQLKCWPIWQGALATSEMRR